MQKLANKEIKWISNHYWLDKNYSEEFSAFFQEKEIERVHQFIQTYKSYVKTPLHSLENLAKHLGVSDIKVKDESYRFGLNSFKVLGGIYSVARYIAKCLGKDIEDLSFEALQSQSVKEQLGQLTFISATDGNHGRGVAWAARELGHKSVIYMPKGSSLQRLAHIRNEGAEAYITELNYDDSVRMCADIANINQWVMVQDTAWKGYDEIPLWIMQGYSSMAKEIVEQLEEKEEQPPTHIFLQAGVGSFAGAITAFMMQHYKENPPIIVVVEPDKADCYYQSFASEGGSRQIVTGDMDTIMAGLACGEPNVQAFGLLRYYAKGVFSCTDPVTALGMRVYGNPLNQDPRVISGESGAVTLGLLYYLRKFREELCEEIALNADSRVLLINSEGDTDPVHYRKVVWEGSYPIESL